MARSFTRFRSAIADRLAAAVATAFDFEYLVAGSGEPPGAAIIFAMNPSGQAAHSFPPACIFIAARNCRVVSGSSAKSFQSQITP